jgi:hypothetical protein
MDFLKRLFGGGRSGDGDAEGVYFYVRSKATGEVIKVRLHRYNDLSQTEDQQGYYARKVIVGQKSFDRIEAEFFFDKNRRFVSGEASGGTLVDQDDYDAYLAAHNQTGPVGS